MSTGRGEFVSRVGEEEVDVCIVEAKRTSELDGGLAQAALQGVTLGKEADRSLFVDVPLLILSLTNLYSSRIQNVIVADGDNWFFAIVDPVNKIARFSPAVILNQHINIRQLIALITIWVDRVGPIFQN